MCFKRFSRQANKVAHELAKFALSCNVEMSWQNQVPSSVFWLKFVKTMLVNDFSFSPWEKLKKKKK